MKFLPSLLSPFVLALLPNPLDAVSHHVEYLFFDTKEEVRKQLKKVNSLHHSLHSAETRATEDGNEDHSDRYLNEFGHSQEEKDAKAKALKTLQQLRHVKVELQSQDKKLESAEKKLYKVEVEGGTKTESQNEKINHVARLLGIVKYEGDIQVERVKDAEKLLHEVVGDAKKGEGRSQTQNVATAKKLLDDVKESDNSLLYKLSLLEPLHKGDHHEKEKRVKSLVSAVKYDIELNAQKVERAEELLRDGVESMKDLVHDLMFGSGSKANKVAKAEDLLHTARHEIKVQAANIAEAEKLLRGLAH